MLKRSTADSLSQYRSMRDFEKTQEPEGRNTIRSSASLSYLIQKHAATRLHYDFRLEMNGVLKSWAVTRGPSLDPADKRLAVHTEDHPLEYGSFEGTIPEGEYGGGTVMLWDTGRWEPIGDPEEGYAKGKLHFRLHGKRLHGEWVLLKMKGRAAREKRENWLLVKVDDEEARPGDGDSALNEYTTSVISDKDMETISGGTAKWKSRTPKKRTARQKTPVKRTRDKAELLSGDLVQLATLVDAPPKGEGWLHEVKFDGYRALAKIDAGDVQMITRAGNDWTRKFQVIADAFAECGLDSALIDGEVVTLQPNGQMHFHDLQHAMSTGDQSTLHYFAFDLLYLNGENLMQKPLIERKKRLQSVIPEGHERLHYSDHFTQSGEVVLRKSCAMALEGIISKRANRPYRPGRSEDWLKSKCIHEQEFVIGGFTEQLEHPGRLGALLIGYYEGSALKFAGKAGTGFTQEEGSALLKKLRGMKTQTSPFSNPVPAIQRRHAQWVKPSLVAQIAFGEWTPAGMLRHPSFNGLREDKPANEVVREKEKPLQKVEAAKEKPKQKKHKKSQAISLTHPDRVLYPEDNITKADLAEYYSAVAPYMLPHVAGRPVSFIRCPEGTAKSCFFQRHVSPGMPEAIHEVDLDHSAGEELYMTINDENGLFAAVQMGVIELHVWGATAENVEQPDRIVFDFDPDESVPWAHVRQAAMDMRDLLEQLNLKSFVKTTGGKGLHVVLPFTPGPGWDEVKRFSEAVSGLLMEQAPDRYTLNSRKAARKGKIYIDYNRNERAASAVAPYSVRAHTGAPVAMPLAWEELSSLKSSQAFTLRTALDHVKQRKKDPWEQLTRIRQQLKLSRYSPFK